MSDGFDMDQALENDAKKVRNATKGDGLSKPPIYKVLVQGLFGLGVLSVVLMIVMLPFTGSGKLIPSELWIGGGLVFVTLFFGLGGVMKWIVGVVE